MTSESASVVYSKRTSASQRLEADRRDRADGGDRRTRSAPRGRRARRHRRHRDITASTALADAVSTAAPERSTSLSVTRPPTPMPGRAAPKTTGRPPVRAASAHDVGGADRDRSRGPSSADLGARSQRRDRPTSASAAADDGCRTDAADGRRDRPGVTADAPRPRGAPDSRSRVLGGRPATPAACAARPRRRSLGGSSPGVRGVDTGRKATTGDWPARGWCDGPRRAPSRVEHGGEHLALRRRPRPPRRRAGRHQRVAGVARAGLPDGHDVRRVLDRARPQQRAPVLDLARARPPRRPAPPAPRRPASTSARASSGKRRS